MVKIPARVVDSSAMMEKARQIRNKQKEKKVPFPVSVEMSVLRTLRDIQEDIF